MDDLYKGTDEQPPSTSPAPAKGKNLWWISCGQASPECATKAAAGKAAAEAMGWQFHLADANLGANGAYDATVRTAIAAKADVIVQDAFSCARNKAPLTEAKQKGILVLGIEALDCDVTGDGPALFTVPFIYNSTMKTGSDYWSAFGTFAADAIINQSGGKAKVISNGGNGDPEFDLMNKGFTSELAKCSGCSVVKNVDWAIADLAPNGPWITAFRDALTRNPDATHVYLPFAFMAVGLNGSQAMRESGTKAKGFGGFGSFDLMDQVRAGQWDTATSAYDLDWIGWGAIDAINRAFNNSPAVPEGIGYAAVDKAHNLPTTAGKDYHSVIDFKSAYKKAWGVG
jgi:ribose transport system substrate-binding protein